jgi:hypothetical protein
LVEVEGAEEKKKGKKENPSLVEEKTERSRALSSCDPISERDPLGRSRWEMAWLATGSVFAS